MTTDTEAHGAEDATDEDPTAAQDASETPDPTDVDLLRKLWRLTLKTLIAELESGEAKASGLAVAKSFLESNGVTRETLDKLDGKANTAAALAPMLARLPSFDD
jgi:hypothetical protein